MKEKISASQAGFMMALLIFSNKIINLPSLLSVFAGGDSIFIILIYFLIEIAVLFLFFRLKSKFPNQSLFSLLKSKIGKFCSYVFFILALIYFYSKIFFTFFSSSIYFKSEVYLENKEIFYVITFLIVTSCFVNGGLRSIGRTVEFFFIPIVAGLLLCLFISFSNYTNPAILFDTSADLVFKGAFRFLFVAGDGIFLFFLMDKISLEKKWKWKIANKVFLTMFNVMLGYFLFFSIFRYTGFMHVNAVSDIITLSYQLFYLGRVDIIAVITFMFLSLLQLGVYAYVFCNILGRLFPKNPIKLNIFVLNVLFLLGVFVFVDSYGMFLLFVTKELLVLALIIQILFPFVTLFFKNTRISKKKRLKYEKSF